MLLRYSTARLGMSHSLAAASLIWAVLLDCRWNRPEDELHWKSAGSESVLRPSQISQRQPRRLALWRLRFRARSKKLGLHRSPTSRPWSALLLLEESVHKHKRQSNSLQPLLARYATSLQNLGLSSLARNSLLHYEANNTLIHFESSCKSTL